MKALNLFVEDKIRTKVAQEEPRKVIDLMENGWVIADCRYMLCRVSGLWLNLVKFRFTIAQKKEYSL